MPYKDKNTLYRKQVKRWIDRKLAAIDYKGGKCCDCGFTGYYGVFHFHHRDPSQKLADWSKIRLWSWDKVQAELDKCDLLCANCHAIRHAT
jgi:hypothetical protein